jgi:hypothetical protein
MTPEALGMAQAILTLLIVPCALIIGIVASIGRARRMLAAEKYTAPVRRPVFGWTMTIAMCAFGAALIAVSGLQITLHALGAAWINVGVGAAIILIGVFKVKR